MLGPDLNELVRVTESNGKKKEIDVPVFKISLKFDLNNHKFYIFRWGNWRSFDPINNLIEVIFDTHEDGINPFTNEPYKGNTDKYHTVLRKIKNKTKPNTSTYYYSIIDKTFYDNTCEEVFKYQTGGNCSIFNSTLDRSEQQLYKLFNIYIHIWYIYGQWFEYDNNYFWNSYCEFDDTEYMSFMKPFVNEINGIMDEMIKHGYFSDRRNLAEELIWGDDPDKLETRNNYKKGGGNIHKKYDIINSSNKII